MEIEIEMETEFVVDIQAAGVDLVELLGERKKAWTVVELADVMNCSTKKLYRMVEKGSIPYFKWGSSIMFNPKAISEWVESQMVSL